MTTLNNTRRAGLILLIVGALGGLLLAHLRSVDTHDAPGSPLSSNVVASVEGRVIPLERYQALLADIAADSRHPLDSSDRQFALDRLIDEELLIVRGIEMGLDQTDPSVRKAIAATMIEAIARDAESLDPDEATLRRFYEENRGYFAHSARRLIHWYRGPLPADPDRAMEMLSRAIEDGGAQAELTSFGLERVETLPERPLSPSKAREYLGPSLAGAARALEPGQWSPPQIVDGQLHVLHLFASVPGREPAFGEVRNLVLGEYRRRQGEAALRRYLEDLRDGRDIRVNSGIVDLP